MLVSRASEQTHMAGLGELSTSAKVCPAGGFDIMSQYEYECDWFFYRLASLKGVGGKCRLAQTVEHSQVPKSYEFMN